MSLAELETATVNDRRFDLIDSTHLYRATVEDAFGTVHGREAVRDRRMAEAQAIVGDGISIQVDLGDMIVFEAGAGWSGHRWASREGDRIVGETLIVDAGLRAMKAGLDVEAEAAALGGAHPAHAALGELRPGRGQLAEDQSPQLPHDWPAGAKDAATLLHCVWNTRAIGLIDTGRWIGPDGLSGDAAVQMRWTADLIAALPDVVLLFERAIVSGNRVAILWRLHGHHLGAGLGHPPTGKRVRALGSSVLTIADGRVVEDRTMLDTLALRTQLHRPEISYAGR